jgi:xylulokinase
MGLYLGIDCSTQGVKAEIIDTVNGEIHSGFAVNFGKDLPEYKCPDGYLKNADPLLYHSDPLMWAAALDMLLQKIKDSGFKLETVAGISGSGQQHGSVYLNSEFETVLSSLNPEYTLAKQLESTLSRRTAPIWMDRSTAKECAKLEGHFGSVLRESTGSAAIERFTAAQIRKFATREPEAYANTAVIHLVSSYMCSILCGKSAPIDHADGSGMNLLDLNNLCWHREITEFTAPGLIDKLPPCVHSGSIVGTLSPYFKKYGFKENVPVAVWSGDNPNSLIGVGAGTPGKAVISLGTSDTFFASMSEYHTSPDGCGHVFANPQGGFMSLCCFTNGSLAREKVMKTCEVSMQFFDHGALEQTEPGNQGKLMLPYFSAESTPLVLSPATVYNFDPAQASAAELCRCILESQACTMRLHSAWTGKGFSHIRLTGGASKSIGFRQILADVFQAEIQTVTVSNSAGLGAAIRAANAIEGLPFEKLYTDFCQSHKSVSPNPANAKIYDDLLRQYSSLEKKRI